MRSEDMQDQKKQEISFQAVTEGLGFHPFIPTPAGPQKLSSSFRQPFRESPAPKKIEKKGFFESRKSRHSDFRADFSVSRFYLLKRMASCFFDFFFGGIIFSSLFIFFGVLNDYQFDIALEFSLVFILVFFLLVFSWSLIVLGEMCFGVTFGKKLFGLKLEGNKRTRFFRACFFLPSFIFFGVGLWPIFFDARKRCWHDRLVNLQPIEVFYL